jgi:hypothetical protein
MASCADCCTPTRCGGNQPSTHAASINVRLANQTWAVIMQVLTRHTWTDGEQAAPHFIQVEC